MQLPQEDPEHESVCGLPLRHMYGTRGAADGWQEEYSTTMVNLGFVQGDASPNVFRHASRRITTSVHGDDYTSSGPASSLDRLERSIAERYEITVDPRLGLGPPDANECRALNTAILWCENRIEYVADPRQVELARGTWLHHV